MAIENEVKYALRGHAALEAALAAQHPWQDVAQGYLNPETRVRRFSGSDGGEQHIFSFKRRLPDGQNVEIETEIGAEEFALLWAGCAETLVKRRFKLADGAVHWDVDFFKDGAGATYFALAEAEMPEGVARPERVPDGLAPHVAFEVGRDDDRFLSRRLSDIAYARGLAALVSPG